QRTTAMGTVSPEIGKFSTALAVSLPHSWVCLLIGLLAAGLSVPAGARRPMRAGVAAASPGPPGAPGTLSAERNQLAREPDGVVIGRQEAGGAQNAQVSVGQEGERFLGDLERVDRIAVRP